MLKREIRDKIMRNAISLERYGLNDLAWSKQDAINLIQEIMSDDIGILGGDVYKWKSGRIKPMCDNWSCEQMISENKKQYYIRSKDESLNYIKSYQINNEEEQGCDIIFSVTFTDQIV